MRFADRNIIYAFIISAIMPLLAGCASIISDAPTEEYREEVEKTYTADGVKKIIVTNTNGDIKFTFEESGEVIMRADKIVKASTVDKARDYASKIDIEVERGSALGFHTKLPSGHKGINRKVDYHITAPRGLVIEARSTNGAITVASGAARVDLKTSNGAVTVGSTEDGENSVATSNGRIELEKVHGPADVKTSNGSVVALNCPGPMNITTSNGRVDFKSGLPIDGDIEITTSNGEVSATVLKTSDISVDAVTSNGSIQSDLSLAQSELKRNSITGKMNAGTHRLDINTSNGRIVLIEQ